MFILIIFGFLAGVATILSPCILPVLPIVLSSSLTGGKKRPMGVVTGFILSFTFFTLSLSLIVQATGVSPDVLRTVAVVIILFFGITLLVPKLNEKMEGFFAKISSFAPQGKTGGEPSSGFGGGVVVGLSIGLIWTPCAGPILASVIALAATTGVTAQAVFITLAYALGTSIPMLFIIYGGRKLLQKVPFLLKNTQKIQKVFAVIIILVAVGIHFNLDRKFQAYILEKLPSYGTGLTKIEDTDIVKNELKKLDMMPSEESIALSNDKTCTEGYGKAPGFDGGGNWLNSKALTLEALKGKVVLVDFWTYTCINCIRTLPYVTGWYDKYNDDGLVVVGVHTPEFEFEKNKDNVASAMKDFKIHYPVVQDNDYKIWGNFNNKYWPAEYLIDKNGCIREEHFGEGGYEETEKNIQKLLKEAGSTVDVSTLGLEEDHGGPTSPETYLGYARILNVAQPESVKPDEWATYTLPEKLANDFFAYGGDWNVGEQRVMAKKGATLEYNFQAKEVYLVMRPTKAGVSGKVKVYLDGDAIPVELAGDDVKNGIVTINKDRLYRLVKLNGYERHTLKLEYLDGNTESFAFTFG